MLYAIVDIETTGGSPKASKITEIAIYKHNGTEIIDEFISLINPEMKIPDFIVRLTGINDRMVAEAPKFYQVAKKIIECLWHITSVLIMGC
jgi:DNA polymerase-3 subunit epsilon